MPNGAKSLVRLLVPARALELVPQSDHCEDQTYSYGRCKADLVHTSYLRLFPIRDLELDAGSVCRGKVLMAR